jgi:hypothetical protein
MGVTDRPFRKNRKIADILAIVGSLVEELAHSSYGLQVRWG